MFALQILTIDVIRYWSLFCVPLAILLFVLPCRMRIRHQARWMMVLLACGMKGIVYEQFGGDAMAPNLPEGLVWFWNWADDGMFFLVLFSLIWWKRRGRAWILPILAWGVALWGQVAGTIAPSVREIEVAFPNLPDPLLGYRIAQVSDLHCSSAARAWRTRTVVDFVNGLDADLVCLTGDYVDGKVEHLSEDLLPLTDLHAKDGVYCIRGNHEYYYDVAAWRAWFAAQGFRFLTNECVFPHKGLALAGVPDQSGRAHGLDMTPDPRNAFAPATNGEFRVLLQHRPRGAEENCREVGVDLQLSGHTHGGVAPFVRKLVRRHNGGFDRGLYRFGGSVLHVSPGCGQWAGFPMRFFNPAEITVITLTRGAF